MNPFTISSIAARRFDIPMRKAFGIAGGAQELARNVLVEISLASGVRGWGEAAPLPPFNGETQEDAFKATERASSLIVGADVREWHALGERIQEATSPSASAACALETAVVDALSRAQGQSLKAWFGNANADVITDITITTGTEEDAAREAKEFAAFQTLKIKVGGSDNHDVDLDVKRVIAAQRARPDARLLLDANGGLSIRDALHLAHALTSRGIYPALFEQPVAKGNWGALEEVRRKSGLKVAIDESVTHPDDVRAAYRANAADAANVKLMKSGIARALEIVMTTRSCGMWPMIGGMVETRLAMGTSACLAAGVGGFAFVDLDTPLFLAEDPFDGGYVQNGERLDLTPIDSGHGCSPKIGNGAASFVTEST